MRRWRRRHWSQLRQGLWIECALNIKSCCLYQSEESRVGLQAMQNRWGEYSASSIPIFTPNAPLSVYLSLTIFPETSTEKENDNPIESNLPDCWHRIGLTGACQFWTQVRCSISATKIRVDRQTRDLWRSIASPSPKHPLAPVQTRCF